MKNKKIKLLNSVESKQKVKKTFCISPEAAEIYERLSNQGKSVARYCAEHVDRALLKLKDAGAV